MKIITKNCYILAIITLTGLAACHPAKQTAKDPVRAAVPASMKGQHPEYFSGTIPCADCEGIRMDLYLGTGYNPNGGHFELSETYLGRKAKALQSAGNWAYGNGDEFPGMKVVILNSDKERKEQRYFLRLPEGRLEMLDRTMKRIKSEHNYMLTLQGLQD